MGLTAVAARTRILIVEDEVAVREGLRAALAASGYEVKAVPDGRGLDATVDAFRPEAAILDVALGCEPDGLSISRCLATRYGIPVIFLTAADEMAARLRGFEAGADDYIIKPFAVAEVLARLRALLRRTGRLTTAVIEIRDLLVDERSRAAKRGDENLDLTPTEFDLLCALARNAGKVLSKPQLLSLVWGFDGYELNLVEVHVSSLRRKLEAHGPRLIHTERGAGYVLRP